MAVNYITDINLNGNELQNAVIQNSPIEPQSPKEGQLWFNSDSNSLHVFNAGRWEQLSNKPIFTDPIDPIEALNSFKDAFRDEVGASGSDNMWATNKIKEIAQSVSPQVDYKQKFTEVLNENDQVVNEKLKQIAGLTPEQEEVIVNKAKDKAKEKVDELRTELLGGTPAEDLDTMLELAEKVREHGDLINVLKAMPKTYVQENVGDGVATSNVINHNLDTLFLDVAVYTPQGERVYVSYTCTDKNNLTIHTGTVALNGHIVKVVG